MGVLKWRATNHISQEIQYKVSESADPKATRYRLIGYNTPAQDLGGNLNM
jgi:hypothetical protein